MPWLNDQNTYNNQMRMLYGTDFEQRYIMLVQNYLDRINPVDPWQYINNAFGWLRNFFTLEEEQLVRNRLCEENNNQKTYMLEQLSVLNPEFASFETARSYLIMQLEDPDPQKYLTYKGKHQPLVSTELFNQVASVREIRGNDKSRIKRDNNDLKEKYLVQNLICCESCRRKLRVYATYNNNKIYYYYPTNNKKTGHWQIKTGD